MGRNITLLVWITCISISLSVINGCQLQGVSPVTRVTVNIFDIDRGDIYYHNVIDITGVIDIVQNAGLNSGPYLSGRISGALFYLATTANYEQYEERETLDTFTLTAQFRCLDGSAITQVFQIDIQDTNNNSPEFLPSDVYDIAIATPLLPGHQLTGCQHNIIVKDIDLTTYRIDFGLTGSDLFEIEYDEESSTNPKEFVAVLKTSTFIRTLPDPVVLTISATDVDLTGNEQRTSYATVTITTDSNAEFPEEPVFSQPLYTARYTEENIIILDEVITLQQGYHENVEFALNEEYNSNFGIIRNENEVSLSVTESLSSEILTRPQIYLVIRADREFTSGATATIVVELPEVIDLRFERSNYAGIIEDDTLVLSDITLTQGYEGEDVTVTVSNDFFSADIQSNIVTLSMRPLTQEIIDGNAFLNLEVVAQTERSTATTVVTLEIVKDDTSTPVFQMPVYFGSYNTENGLTLDQIELIQGFDDTVEITLDGELLNIFQLIRDGPSSRLTVESIPPALFSERNIALTIIATKPRTVGSTAVINIALPADRILQFEENTYKGTYQNEILRVETITLSTGYDETVTFDIDGDYAQYFRAINTSDQVSINLFEPLPNSFVLENNFLQLTITASGMNAISATSSLLIEIIKDDVSTPLFNQNIYTATFAEGNIEIQNINLIQGFDSTVSFKLDGDDSQYFSFNEVGNGITLSLSSAIPEEVIFNQKSLVFSVLAEKPLTVGAHATIIITFPSELTDLAIMRFSQNTYVGSWNNSVLSLDDIILSMGYLPGTEFFLTGEYYTYFALSHTNEIVSINPSIALPQDIIENNKFIVLEVEARRDRAASVFSSVVIEIIHEVETMVEIPVFNAAYYRGSYNLEDGFQFTDLVYLVQGYDATVTFDLQGDFAELFSVSGDDNVVTLSLNEMPENVWEANQQLILTLVANKPETISGFATIIIDMTKEADEHLIVLGFERTSYVGSIENDIVALQPITLTEGYSNDVVFSLFGDLNTYFAYSRDGATINLRLDTAIPEELIPTNGIIVVEIQASTPTDSLPAVTTVVLDVIRDSSPDVENLVFGQTYYIGSYTASTGLTLENPITLNEGYTEDVRFTLDGDNSNYFTISQDGNSITFTVGDGIPPAVVINTNQLIFTINAQSPGGASAQATVVILLPDELDENLIILGFERTSYVGSIENDIVTIQPITLTEGYSNDVVFSLFGDLNTYFAYSRDGATISLRLDTAIPEELIPTNGIIVVEIQASTPTDSLPAVTTVVLNVIRDSSPDVENLVFGQTYYIGTYTASTGLTLENPITLIEGYTEDVQFTLDGDSSNYFTISQDGNSITFTMGDGIPPAVVINTNQLIFTINAQSPGGASAQATVVILLPDELDENLIILGFERTSYVGSIENDIVTIQPITLTEGYSNDVVFSLFGDLNTYFAYSRDGATISLRLDTAIPEELIPTNGIIVVEIQASTPTDSLPAVTTVVLDVIRDSSPDVENLVFGQTYYIGTYTASTGLTLENPITLIEGYTEDVQFTLDGDSSNYFTISQDGNSITFTMGDGIPPAVVINTNQLIFTINAQSPGGASAQATVVILLPDELDENLIILGFERTSYVGSIENDIVTIQPITLTEGYSNDVVFSLFGDLNTYFAYSRDGATISLRLDTAIPEELIPTNGIIVVEIQASTPTDSLPAVTTVVLDVIRDSSPDVENLVFGQTYYIGTYTASTGLTLENPITLIEGYTEDVQFTLDGDSSNYFTISQDGNSITFTMGDGIPPAVVINTNQLIFTINAQSPGGASAQATVVILLPDELDENLIFLGFERTSYVGSIENDIVTIQPITLTEGYSNDVVFSLFGDLNTYFAYSRDGATISLRLDTAIPEELIPTNGIIVVEIQASTPTDSLPAVTTVVLNVIRDSLPDVENLVFGQTYYIGTYTASTGLTLENPITLIKGYTEDVRFTLDGDSSNYFTISQDGNSITFTMGDGIPPAVVINTNQLIFTINAQSPGRASAQATVVILLPDELDENLIFLGFERTSYVGSIENDIVTIQPITLTEGYSNDVVFSLFGDLNTYFTYSRDGATISLRLDTAIPEELIPTNGIIVVEIQASTPTDSLPAVTTVVLNVIRDSSPDVENLVFGQTYYIGTYTASTGLTLENPITLIEGYTEDVRFTLDGDSSNYFTISQDGNSITFTMGDGIPPAVVINTNQLIFTINAQSPGGASAQATVVILLPDELDENLIILGFERTSYVGSIENDIVTIQPITLTEGYSNDVVFSLFGDLSTYFAYSRDGATISLRLDTAIPEELIPTNGIIVVEIQASTPTDSLPAVTTVVLDVIRDSSPDVENLVFGQTYYIGTYTASSGLTLENPITLIEGYTEDVRFTLDGDNSNYFTISQDGNSITFTLGDGIPPAVVINTNQLIFTINAQSPGGASAQATVVILLPNELDENLIILGFERTSYVGSIENDLVTIQPITLTEGYSNDVVYSLFGDLSTYFAYSRDGATISLRLDTAIPEELIPTNGIIVVEIQASTPTDSLPAVTTVVLDVIRDSSPDVENLVFGQTYYIGSYTASTGLTLENPITLIEGYTEDVRFTLEGDSSNYFTISQDGNSITFTVGDGIPPAVVINTNQLIFTINAQSPGGASAQATVVILLPDELDENLIILGFERTSYVGSIENDIVTIQPITLTEGYSNDVVFSLFGDLSTYFAYSRDGATISLRLDTAIPEELIPTNGIIVVEIQASTPTDSLPAVTTVVLDVIRDSSPDVENLVFGQTYYIGTYTASTGLTLENPITLIEGYTEDVRFTLEGDSSNYFTISQDGNSITFTVGDGIPPAVVINTNQLIFTINAQSPGGASAQATVVILLPDELDENLIILGFERTSYVGSIENDIVTIQPITLTEGYSNDVVFSLFGDLSTYFAYSRDGATISLRLDTAIPEELIPTNGIIVVEIQASTPTDSLPAVTTVVLDVIRDSSPDVENLVFGQTYYIGSYTASTGLTLENPITLIEGYTEDVRFTLEGDSSNYFTISQDGNSITFTVGDGIPPAVVINTNQLIFTINAQSPGGASAQATVVILLPDELDENLIILGFERTSYVGSIENDIVTIQPITLTEGYSNDVVFSLFGDLSTYFAYSRDGATISLRLDTAIPEELIPTNGIIVVEIQASTPTDSLPAVTTVVLDVIRDSSPDVENLVFGQTYYIGTYTASTGLTLENPITLIEGYTEDVRFTLEGDSSNYFTISQDGNSITFTVGDGIPPAVVINTNQLIFTINAQSPGGASAQATVVILLPDELDENLIILGFERTSYVGSIENDIVTIQPITLTEGYSNDVVFSLFGDLSTYFAYSRDGATISLRLDTAIPEELIPTNGIIVVEIQASTPTDSLPAVTTVVLNVIRDSSPDVENLVFGQTYYIGTYTASTGLTLENPITLIEGYTEDVRFTLDGDSSNYFTISQDGNSITFTVGDGIPPAVVINTNQLIFTINAQSPGGASAQATVVILLPDELDENLIILGFERTSYVGSIENDLVTIQPITLTEGYSNDVVFSLFGDLSTYFAYSRDGATISLRLDTAIPEELIPTNGIIVVEIQASTPTDSLPAVTTVVLDVIRDSSPDVENLVFGQTYYIGTYTASTGLTLENPITLIEGYTEDVRFTLDGDNSNYFTISQDGNSITFTLGDGIPPAVVINTNQLIFTINAQSPGGASAQATVVILLPNELDENLIILGFERTSYVGSIENDLVTIQPITLTEGYSNDVVFSLFGDLSTYFAYSRDGATISLRLDTAIPEELIPTNGIIVVEIQASTPTDSLPAVTTVVLDVIRDSSPDVENLVFGQTYYIGTYTASSGLTLENPITLIEGYTEDIRFTLDGDSSNYFTISQDGNSITFTVSDGIPPAVVINTNQLIFTINAQSPGGASAQATVVILLPDELDENLIILGFERTSYVGSIENGIVTIQPITLTEGYSNDVVFSLFGELQNYFDLSRNGATVSVVLVIPENELPVNGIIVLGVQASTVNALPAVATIILEVERLGSSSVVFSKVLYEGLLQADLVQHETISVIGYSDTTVELKGDYAALFTGNLSEGRVTVQRTGSVTLPIDVTHIGLEIHVEDAATVLLIHVFHTDTPNPPPTVTFSPSSYVVRAQVLQTGVVGRVSAAADNGESLRYSVNVEDAHLAPRISINNDGELLLTSPANTGEYTFQVVATTSITQADGMATVHLTVEDTSIILQPLIVIDRDEEEPHENLVVFSSSEYTDCSYTLTNRFPTNQDWLYIDQNGLHARTIDREDPSIAFMALSQIQVELEVHCNTLSRNKRSVHESRLNWLGPYDYGTSTWIIGESIPHNPTKSIVNLIVNDINDNAPIFVGKENEPIVVGYPIPELEEIVLPRALAQLQATDADVGENAALVYWSAEPELAVSPTSGSVHVRDDSTLQEGQQLVVHATDRNGVGLSGAINLLVKLLDESKIAVVTVRNSFLEDESSIIANLSDSVGYEVRVLRAVVISDETDNLEAEVNSRKKRQTSSTGASLELFVYGLIDQEPVAADVLVENINNSTTGAVSIADTISLQDHLEARQIHTSGRDVGLLVATIVLSVLLFILIVAILVWFFLKWRKEKKYEEFSDENSLESRNESIVEPSKVDVRPKPRINIDELKRSERRLQEMIDAPYNDIVTPTTSTKEPPVESIIDIGQPEPNILLPIVIKDKLKDADEDPSEDEFGEVRPPRRKSVVTFNENVEKIIHVDDSVEGSSTTSDVEIFRF